MKRIARFEKVSFEEYLKAVGDKYPIDYIRGQYDNIKLPKRATVGSAGYDFFAPDVIALPDDDSSVIIPTGIRCKMKPGYVLSIYPRSGLGFKYRVALDNTTGIIDQDYYGSENEGHIIIKLHSKIATTIPRGKAFAQGIFTEFFITEDDYVEEERHGGFGSTSENQ